MSAAIKALEAHLANGTASEEELSNFVRMYDSRKMHNDMQKLQESVAKGDIDASKVNAVFAEAETKRKQREAKEAADAERLAIEEQKKADAAEAARAAKEEASK